MMRVIFCLLSLFLVLALRADGAYLESSTDYVSVTNFSGVDPSGVTDSTVGIQAALNVR